MTGPGNRRASAKATRTQELCLRNGWLFALALALQVLISKAALLGIPEPVHPALMAGSYALLVAGAARNWHVYGLRLLLIGACLNILPMALNGWRMPISPEALARAGFVREASLPVGTILASSKDILLPGEATHLRFLSDVLVITSPVRRVLSIGDVFVYSGTLAALAQMGLALWRSTRQTSCRRATDAGPIPPGQ